jgi:glycosyltransferase involved in cell wall biosynthesis
MRIVFLIDDLTSGGAQRQMVNLAIAFSRNGYSVSVITYYKRDYYKESLIKEGIEIMCFPVTNAFKRITKIRKEILSRKPDVVFSYILIPNFIACLSTFPFKKFKLIVGERSADPKLLTSWKSITLRYFHGRADYIVTNSIANKELLNIIVPFYSHKVKVIYNMLDLDFWKPRERFKFRGGSKLRLGVAASHRFLKNAKGMLEALNLLDEHEKGQIEVYWFGKKLTPPYLDDSIIEVMKLVELYGLEQVVYLKDETVDIRNEMMEMDAVGLFSFFEGLPNAVCEGMALGKPIIASAVSDVPKLIDNNTTGFLFDPKSTSEIAEAFRKLLQLSPEAMTSMGKMNRAKAEQLFDHNIIYSKFKDLVQDKV